MAHCLLIEENFTARIEAAMDQTQQRQAFDQRFPPLSNSDPAPSLTWDQIERQLTFLSGTDRPRWELGVLRKQAQGMPPEFFLQQLLILAWAIIDDSPDTVAATRGRHMD